MKLTTNQDLPGVYLLWTEEVTHLQVTSPVEAFCNIWVGIVDSYVLGRCILLARLLIMFVWIFLKHVARIACKCPT